MNSEAAEHEIRALRETILPTMEALSEQPGEVERLARIGQWADQRLGEPISKTWDGRAGELIRDLALSRAATNPAAAMLYGYQAKGALTRAGRRRETATLDKLLRESAGRLNWHTVTMEVEDYPKWLSEERESIRRVFNESGPHGAIEYVVRHPHSIPNAEKVVAELGSTEPSLADELTMRTTLASDARQLEVAGPGERAPSAFSEHYSRQLILATLPVRALIVELIEPADVRASHIVEWLRQTWLSQELDEQSLDHIAALNPCISLVADVITKQTEQDRLRPAIDSLTLRFAAILRSLARLADIPTWIRRDDGVEVRDFDLLDEEELKKLIGTNLTVLVQQVLKGEPEGWRDRVAHAMTTQPDYDLRRLEQLLLILLLLARAPVGKKDGGA